MAQKAQSEQMATHHKVNTLSDAPEADPPVVPINDMLNLGKNQMIQDLIISEGGNKETILYTEKLVKINRKGKNQDREFMITEDALYNLRPGKYKKSKRRVPIELVGMVTLSAESPEFAIHIPSEYDYHLCSKNKEKIVQVLQALFESKTKKKLLVVNSAQQHLKEIIVTKKLAKYESVHSQHAMQDTYNSVHDLLVDVDVTQLDDEKVDSDNHLNGGVHPTPQSAMTESPDIDTPAIQAHVAIQAEFANLNLSQAVSPPMEEQILQ